MLSIEYVILIVLLLLYLYKNNSRALFYAIVGYMILLGMMRGLNVGTDHAGYADDFYKIQSLDNARNVIFHRFEWGYLACIVLFKQFSNDYLTFASLAVPPTVLGFVAFVNRYKVNKAQALAIMVVLGYYFFSYNAMRQTLAISLILAFIGYIHQQKYIHFAIATIIIAFLFHQSTLLLLALLPIHRISLRQQVVPKKTLSIILVASFIAYYIGKHTLQNTLIGINTFIGMGEFNGYILNRNISEEIENTTSMMFTIYSLIFLYIKKDKGNIFETICFIMYVVLYNTFQMMGSQSGRIAIPFLCFYSISIPLVLKEKSKYSKLFTIVTVVFCLGYFYFKFYLGNTGAINPYYWRTF